MNKDNLKHSIQQLIRELCVLADKGIVLPKDKFHMVCEQENFIEFISTEYAPKINLEYFDKASELRKQETVDYINDAFSRYANAQTMEDLGLKNNALFFAICISCKILEEMSPT